MASFEETSKSFHSKFEDMIKNITIATLPMQKKMYQCCVSCFDTYRQDFNKVSQCINQCHDPTQNFNRHVHREVEGLQATIESCQKNCYNRLEPKLEAASKSQKADLEKEKDACFARCFNDNAHIIQEIGDRLKRRIE